MPRISSVYDHQEKLRPLDRVADRVLRGESIEYTPPVPLIGTGFEGRPPLRMDVPDEYAHLVGRVIGRVTVLGLLHRDYAPLGKFIWVVQCSCGTYEYRNNKAVFYPKRWSLESCVSCLYNRILKGELTNICKANPGNYFQALCARFIGQESITPEYILSDEEQLGNELHVTVTVFVGNEKVVSVRGIGKNPTRRQAALAAIRAKHWG